MAHGVTDPRTDEIPQSGPVGKAPVQAPDRPGTLVPPPLPLVAAIAVGHGLQQLRALELTSSAALSVGAWAVIGAAVTVLVTAWVQFFRARTSVLHNQPSSHVIRGGIYRFSRNPIYVSALLLQLGIALLMNNLWIVLLVPVTKLVLDRYVIAREEAYLERAFGDVYVSYKRDVQRWL